MNKNPSRFFKSGNQIRLNEQTIFGTINVVQQGEFPENINFNNILKKLEIVVPEHFIQNLDGIYVGDYDFLLKRDLNALYKDGVVYVWYKGEDVVPFLKTLENDDASSIISQVLLVRNLLLPLQKSLSLQYNLVSEGRDCGTKIFPQADFKFFLNIANKTNNHTKGIIT